MDADVLIVGAGPVGCFLARELRLGGASVVVLEAQAQRSPFSKALTMNCRSVELLDMRGLAERFLREGARMPTAHFAGLETRLALAPLDTKHPYTLVLAQRRTEELLELAARELGARFEFSRSFTSLVQDADGVTAHFEDAPSLRARYLVGCDGARSTVRSAVGIEFPGTGTTMTAFQGDVRFEQTPPPGVMNERGALMMVRQADGTHRVVVTDVSRAHVPRAELPTAAELQASIKHIAGTDFGLKETLWLSRFGNATRLASAYRQGRVFLAGDAAHIHFPAGGQGMNVGLQDAINLGWKLAVAVRGGPDLLDSYHVERHPVGARLIANTRAQEALIGFTPQLLALRAAVAEMIRNPEVNRQLAEDVTGLAVKYPGEGWVGRRMPDVDGVFEKLRGGTFVTLAAPSRADFAGLAELTLRPDGHVASVR